MFPFFWSVCHAAGNRQNFRQYQRTIPLARSENFGNFNAFFQQLLVEVQGKTRFKPQNPESSLRSQFENVSLRCDALSKTHSASGYATQTVMRSSRTPQSKLHLAENFVAERQSRIQEFFEGGCAGISNNVRNNQTRHARIKRKL